jgi:hypothetical protein
MQANLSRVDLFSFFFCFRYNPAVHVRGTRNTTKAIAGSAAIAHPRSTVSTVIVVSRSLFPAPV